VRRFSANIPHPDIDGHAYRYQLKKSALVADSYAIVTQRETRNVVMSHISIRRLEPATSGTTISAALEQRIRSTLTVSVLTW
jgi:hypothetical protein